MPKETKDAVKVLNESGKTEFADKVLNETGCFGSKLYDIENFYPDEDCQEINGSGIMQDVVDVNPWDPSNWRIKRIQPLHNDMYDVVDPDTLDPFYEVSNQEPDNFEEMHSDFDELDQFVKENKLDTFKRNGSKIVNHVIDAIKAATSFNSPVMRYIALLMLNEAEKVLVYVSKNRSNVNGNVPKGECPFISPFPEYFNSLNGELKKFDQYMVKDLLFGVYKPICKLVGKRYYPKDRFILQNLK